jgi:hypothetical protein
VPVQTTEPVVPQAPAVEVPVETEVLPTATTTETPVETPVETPSVSPATGPRANFSQIIEIPGETGGQGVAQPLGSMGIDSKGRSYFTQNYPGEQAGTFGRINRVSTVTKEEQERILTKMRTVDEMAFRYPEEFGSLEKRRMLFNSPQAVLDDIIIQRSMTKTVPKLVYETRPDGSQSTQMKLVDVEVPNPDWKVEKSIFQRDENGEIVEEQRQDFFYLSLMSTGKDREAELYEKLFTIDEAIGEVEEAMEEGYPINTDFIVNEKKKMIQELITLGYDQTQINQILRQFSTRPELYQGAE